MQHPQDRADPLADCAFVGCIAIRAVGNEPVQHLAHEIALLRNDPEVASLMAAEHASDNKTAIEGATGRAGRLREMSARSRPSTRTVPPSVTSACTVTRAETS